MPKYKCPVTAYGYVIVEAGDAEQAALDIYFGDFEITKDNFIVDEYTGEGTDEFPEEVR